MYNADQAKRDADIMAERQQLREFSDTIDAIRHAVNEGHHKVVARLRFPKLTIPKLKELGYQVRRVYPSVGYGDVKSPNKAYMIHW